MRIGKFEPSMPVKKYANERLYRPAPGAYLAREDLIAMVKRGEKFVVIDAPSATNCTLSFRPIIVEH